MRLTHVEALEEIAISFMYILLMYSNQTICLPMMRVRLEPVIHECIKVSNTSHHYDHWIQRSLIGNQSINEIQSIIQCHCQTMSAFDSEIVFLVDGLNINYQSDHNWLIDCFDCLLDWLIDLSYLTDRLCLVDSIYVVQPAYTKHERSSYVIYIRSLVEVTILPVMELPDQLIQNESIDRLIEVLG
jgi:hypothetical protein